MDDTERMSGGYNIEYIIERAKLQEKRRGGGVKILSNRNVYEVDWISDSAGLLAARLFFADAQRQEKYESKQYYIPIRMQPNTKAEIHYPYLTWLIYTLCVLLHFNNRITFALN